MVKGALSLTVNETGAAIALLIFQHSMLQVDDSEFTPDHLEFLQEWANNLGVSMEVLLARIVLATSEGELYIEQVPDLRPD